MVESVSVAAHLGAIETLSSEVYIAAVGSMLVAETQQHTLLKSVLFVSNQATEQI